MKCVGLSLGARTIMSGLGVLLLVLTLSASGTSASVVQVMVLGQAWFAVTSNGDLYACAFEGSAGPDVSPEEAFKIPRRVLTHVQVSLRTLI